MARPILLQICTGHARTARSLMRIIAKTPSTSAVLLLVPISLPVSPKRMPAIMGRTSRVVSMLVVSLRFPVVFGFVYLMYFYDVSLETLDCI